MVRCTIFQTLFALQHLDPQFWVMEEARRLWRGPAAKRRRSA
jgi:hypothetical protein